MFLKKCETQLLRQHIALCGCSQRNNTSSYLGGLSYMKKLEHNLEAVQRQHNDKEFTNLYLYIDGKKFEVVPRCWTVKEKAYFYSLLSKSDLMK